MTIVLFSNMITMIFWHICSEPDLKEAYQEHMALYILGVKKVWRKLHYVKTI